MIDKQTLKIPLDPPFTKREVGHQNLLQAEFHLPLPKRGIKGDLRSLSTRKLLASSSQFDAATDIAPIALHE